MSTLYVSLTILLVFVSIALIALVLLQKGKGADAGAAFGAGASGTVFGARGSTNFLSRSTSLLATVFFAVCLALAYLSAQRSEPSSLLDELEDTTPAAVEDAAPASNEEAELAIPDEATDPMDLPLEIPEDATESQVLEIPTDGPAAGAPADEGNN
ncbi:MAG: preprotein translocase subunit SecG [Pseudomonadota bacterium]